VTVRHLLTHTSGAACVQGILATSKGKTGHSGQDFCRATGIRTGDKMIYSDLGIILLAETIHRLTGKNLDELTREDIFSPLGMNHTMYLPRRKFGWRLRRRRLTISCGIV